VAAVVAARMNDAHLRDLDHVRVPTEDEARKSDAAAVDHAEEHERCDEASEGGGGGGDSCDHGLAQPAAAAAVAGGSGGDLWQ